MTNRVCRMCSSPLTDGSDTCPRCGFPVGPASTDGPIDDATHIGLRSSAAEQQHASEMLPEDTTRLATSPPTPAPPQNDPRSAPTPIVWPVAPPPPPPPPQTRTAPLPPAPAPPGAAGVIPPPPPKRLFHLRTPPPPPPTGWVAQPPAATGAVFGGPTGVVPAAEYGRGSIPPRRPETILTAAASSGHRVAWLSAALLAAAVVAIIVILVAVNAARPPAPDNVSQPDGAAATPTPAGSDLSPTEAPSPMRTPTVPPLPVTQSQIDLTQVATVPNLTAFASVLDTYFTGINSHNAQQAASVFGPGGAIDPNDANQVAHFAQGISTTHDDQIAVTSIQPSTVNGQATFAVQITFRSHQDASLGPNNETCTMWQITDQFLPTPGSYQIVASQNAVSNAC